MTAFHDTLSAAVLGITGKELMGLSQLKPFASSSSGVLIARVSVLCVELNKRNK